MWCERIFSFVKRNATVPGALVVFAVTYILVLAMNAGQAGAGWVQAIGSVGAIIAAVVISNHQHNVATALAKADRHERERALSKRLAFLALELEQIVVKVIPANWDMEVHEADRRVASVLESMLGRINHGFDDDLNAERVAMLYEFRTAISGLIFTLKSTGAIYEKDRDESIATYKEIVKGLLERCIEHAKRQHLRD